MSSDEQANIIVNDDRITLLTDNKMGMASLTYSPIAITDSGWITATVTVSPCNDSFILPITATSSYSLHVEGKYLLTYNGSLGSLGSSVQNCYFQIFQIQK